MRGQGKGLQERRTLCRAVGPAGKAEGEKVLLCDRLARGRGLRVFKIGAGVSQRLQKDLRAHALHAEQALFAGRGLAPLLAGDVGDVGVQHAFCRQGAFERVADEKTGAVGVGQDDEARRLCGLPQQAQQRGVLHAGKAVGGEDRSVDQLPQGVLVVFSLDDDRLPDAKLIHAAPPAKAARAAAPAAARGRRRRSSWRRRSAEPAPPPSGRSRRSRGARPSWSGPRGSS